jgi:hypothetical protein
MSALDLAALVKQRMDNPRELPQSVDGAAIGRAAVRQLYDTTKSELRWRLSGLGKCARALAYIRAGVPIDGRRIDARSRLTFALGDITEAVLVHALAEALEGHTEWGLKNIGEEQAPVWLDVGEPHEPIKGHPDGIILRGGKPWAVLEIKSAASYGFQRASKLLAEGVCPWDEGESYWWQAQAYMQALDLDRAGVLMLCKDSGAVQSFWVFREPDFLPLLRIHLDLASAPPEDVPRLMPNGEELTPRVELSKRTGKPLKKHGQLSWVCRYCSHYNPCWGDRLSKTVQRDYRGAPAVMLYVDRPDLAAQ